MDDPIQMTDDASEGALEARASAAPGELDVELLFQQLRDAIVAALGSGDPGAARGRFDRALALRRQLASLELPDAIQGQLDGFVTDLEARFPTAWRINAAGAAAERAGAAASVDAQRADLEEAASLLRGGLDDPGADRSALESALVDVERALRELDAAPLDAEAAAAIVPASSGSPEEHADTFRVEVEEPAPAAPVAALLLRAQPEVHGAMLNSRVAPVQALEIRSEAAEDLRDLTLEVTSEPPLVLPSSLSIRSLTPGESLELGPRRVASFLRYDHAVLRSISEVAEGTLRVRLVDASGAELATAVETWRVHPSDSWSGLGTLPEILAAFVLPNDDAVQTILARAGALLEESTGQSALDGYQSKDPKRVLRIAEAIHRAIAAEGITYANPPASFESAGQRVRFPSRILGTRLATCLDLALLESACLEQAGLHPIVVVTEGHAMAAAWLVERNFNTPVVDEFARFGKRVELTEIVVMDSVTVTAEPSPGFDGARAQAGARLENPAEFLCAVDVARARLGGVRPIWTLAGEEPPQTDARGGSHDAGIESSRDLDAEVEAYLAAEKRRRQLEETPATRLDRWLRQLLDLTMRNRLLNSSSTSKRVLPLLAGADLGAIEDRLAEGKAFRVVARPTELAGVADPTPADLEPLTALFEAGVERGQLYSSLGEAKLAERLTHLYREARTAREEGGSSSLYLAIGFLEYLETHQATRPRRAPLLLVPLELKRKTGGAKGYSLSIGADEPRVNVTLLEYLRRDHEIEIAGLDPLPTDDRGIDVPLVLRIIKGAVKDMDGWRVDEALQVGLYSFAKYLLWRDLRDREADLRRSPLVEHLIDRPAEPYPHDAGLTAPGELDGAVGAAEVFAPMSYDSSQLSAILGAAAGATMVLEGPPGTGKSQTITNLIAHSIGAGKSVLFVSEKMAALDVVQRRLDRLGLGPACLELHSNKANKKAVLAQFKEALDAGRVRGARRRPWDEIAADVDAARARLNGHVAAMHEERASGETVHGMIADGASAEEPAGALDLGLDDPRSVDAATLGGWRAALDELDVHAGAAGVDPDHPLLLVGQTETSPLFDAESRRALLAFDAPAARWLEVAPSARDTAGLGELELGSPEGWSALAKLLRAGSALPDAPGGALPWLADPGLLEVAGRLVDEVREFGELRAGLDAALTAPASTLDLDGLEVKRREMEAGGWLKRWLRGRALRKAVGTIARDPRSVDAARIVVDGLRARSLEQSIAAAADVGRRTFGSGWAGAGADPAEARSFLDLAGEVSGAFGALCEAEGVRPAEHADALEAALISAAPATLAERASDLEDAGAALAAVLDGIRDAARPLVGAPRAQSIADVTEWRALSRRWASAWRDLRVWTRYQSARRAAVDVGLHPVVTAVETGALPAGGARRAFDRSFESRLLLHEISADDRLKAFDGVDHGRAIERYRELDEERLSAATEEVRARLGSKRPTSRQLEASSGRSGGGLTGLSLLQRELAKKTRHVAIRRLIQELGEVAMELKPCFLMSPMSVAQYLEADHPPFDLVVFDEASQIPVWDAVGALARGRQAVVVGDPKQLPPTSFFARGEDESIAEDDIEDLESILEECIGAQVPTHRLNWHYRSRDESLIAFSNERYYGGELITFPSAGANGAGGVSVRHVEGVYEKGASRTNPIEAQAVVDEVVARLVSGGKGSPSIGVVTFNQAQQQLVLDLFEQALAGQPELEPHFAESNDEGVFVKNLENVQGDERDVIVFSIGYGPDERGRVSMNFGPLNKDGGERRLNVAITRARQEVMVFSSLRSDQIDLARTSARGVRDLRAFLRFGEGIVAARAARPAAAPAGDRLVASVAAALEARGHSVDVEVGRGGVRLDLAVRDPRVEGRYLIGVETDGESYRGASTARDRDRLRELVLGGLGWRIERLWGVDWWRDAEAELDRLEGAIRAAEEASE